MVEQKASRVFKLAMCQVKTVKDKATNLAAAKRMITDAASRGAQVIMLPEMFVTPFQKEFMLANAEPVMLEGFEADARCETSQMLSSLAKETQTYIIGGSIPELVEGDRRIYNTLLCFNKEGKITATHRKQHLFDVDIPGGITFFESNYVSAGPAQLSTF